MSSTLTPSIVDSIVLSTLKTNKFSSVAFISHLTRLSERIIGESFDRLLREQKIYLSVGGLPKRYSHSDEREQWSDDVAGVSHTSSSAPNITLPEGTVIH